MKKNILQFKKFDSGAVMMVSVIFFVVISVIAILGITGPTARDYKTANDSILSNQSYFLAESGTEDVYYRLKNGKSVDQTETLVLGSSYTSTRMDNLGAGNVDINSIGNVSNHLRGADIKISGQDKFVLSFGVQSGAGGVSLEDFGSGISGDVFTNGPIVGAGGSNIYGTAVSISSALSLNQSNDTGTPPYDIWFGDSDSTRDIFQSFSVSQGSPLNKISLYMKKIGSPSDLNMYIYNNDDSTNKPGTFLLATSMISASSVGASYSWVDAVFSQKQTLSIGKTYWFVVQGTTSSVNYYTIATTGDVYSNGTAKIAQLGSSSWWASPVSPSADYFFRIYLGGLTGSIGGNSNGGGNINIGTTSAHIADADSVNYANVSGNIYCNTGASNNKSCSTYDNPSSLGYAISDTDIARWKADASSGGACVASPWNTGTFSKVTAGPRKCSGDVNIAGGSITINGTLWITGNLNIYGGGRILLNSAYGARSGVVIVDGKVSINNGYATGSGTSGSHILIISNNNSLDNTSPAILAAENGSENAMFFAPYGLVRVIGSSVPHQVSGYKISLSDGANIAYDSALSLLQVLSTSSSSTSYSISSWLESQ